MGKIKHGKKRAFLAAYETCASISKAADIAKCSRNSHQIWLKADPEYALAFEEAKISACQALEDEAVRRANDGVDEPVFYQGAQCGTVRKYSDTLLIFLLKGMNPGKYRENRSVEISGPGGGPIEIEDAKRKLLDRIAGLAASQSETPGD